MDNRRQAKKCPRCGLFNPPSAILCDCGYHFEQITVSDPDRPITSEEITRLVSANHETKRNVPSHQGGHASKTKKCPYCGEEILVEARKCKHCSEFLDKPPKQILAILCMGLAIACFLIGIVVIPFHTDAENKKFLSGNFSTSRYLELWFLFLLTAGIILLFLGRAAGSQRTSGFWGKVIATAIGFAIILFIFLLTFAPRQRL